MRNWLRWGSWLIDSYFVYHITVAIDLETKEINWLIGKNPIYLIHSFSILSDDRSKASSKAMPPHSAIQSLLLQMRISSPVLKVIQ